MLVEYSALIKNTATGESAWYRDNWDMANGGIATLQYLWEEGNFSCDCNRSSLFGQARGLPENDETYDDTPCSDGAFQVPCLWIAGGERIEIDEVH